MIEVIKEIFMTLGMCVVAVIIYGLFCAIINKFNRWRKNGCKIKCLCKPHIYKAYWIDDFSGETFVKCEKCGKEKKIVIDIESFKNQLQKGEKICQYIEKTSLHSKLTEKRTKSR